MTTDPTPDPAAVAARHKHILREMLAGYAVANEVIRIEKREWLQGMTPAESWATYEGLVAFGRRLQGDPASLEVLEQRRIEDHLHMRRIFERLAKAKGLI